MRDIWISGLLLFFLCSFREIRPQAAEASSAMSEQKAAPVRLIGDEEFHRILADAQQKLAPDSAPDTEQLASLFRVYIASVAVRDYAGAEKYIRRMLQLFPNGQGAYSNLSVVLGKQGKYEDAIKAADQELSPPGKSIRIRRHATLVKASWLWRTGKQKEADALVATVTDLGKDPEELFFSYACLACYNGDKGDEAKTAEYLTKVIELARQYPELAPYEALCKRDIVFDPYREKDWFLSLFGKTLADSGVPATTPATTGATAPEVK